MSQFPPNHRPRYGGRGGTYVGNNARVYQYGPVNGVPEYEQSDSHINKVYLDQSTVSAVKNYHENHNGAEEFFR